jgi:hypothetical protein
MSDTVRPSPTMSDHDGQRPTMSATRSDQHTMTTTEVVQLFDSSALPREKRSIERYCEQGKLDCFKDPDELRYYVTRTSAEKLIGHLKELKERHPPQPSAPVAPPPSATAEQNVRHGPTVSRDTDDVKRGTPDTQGEKHATGEHDEQLAAMEARIKELENKNFNLEIDKRAKEEVIGLMREEITKQLTAFSSEIVKQSRRVGQLETRIKYRQLPAPDSDTTADDEDDLDDATTIEAEFSEGPPPATEHPL